MLLLVLLPVTKKINMILSDQRILEEIEKGSIKIEPYTRECLGSNSYDVHLGMEKIISGSKKEQHASVASLNAAAVRGTREL